jgi:hypothetical protein
MPEASTNRHTLSPMSWLDVVDWLGGLPTEVVLAVPVVFLAGLFGIILALRRARLRRWQRIAARAGLRLNAKTIVDSPELSGDYRGRRLTMTIASRQKGSTRLRKTWTLVAAEVANPTFLGLKVYRQDVVDTLLTSLGLPDLKVGDVAFDKRFLIQSADPPTAKQLLENVELRNDLTRADIERVEMFGSKLVVYYAREERDAGHAQVLFDAVVRLANAIDSLKKDDKPERIL